MRLKLPLMLLCILGLLLGDGCDLSTSNKSTNGGTPGTGGNGGGNNGGPQKTPLFFALEQEGNTTATALCVGTAVDLVGVNFSNILEENQVMFSAATVRIPGIPIGVEFPNDGNPQNGLESRLHVLVPGGVSTGNVELTVNGIFAGSNGYDACPQVMAYTLGRNEKLPFLAFTDFLGFSDQGGASFIKLYGINFTEIQEVTIEDTKGSSTPILPNTIIRNPISPGAVPPNVPTGYSSIGFFLHDTKNDVQPQISNTNRDNIKIRVKGASGESNTIEVPVVSTSIRSTPAPDRSTLGVAINSIKVPTGVRTGPVRIRYNLYDLQGQVKISYRMEASWSVDGGENWNPAKPDLTDGEMDGPTGILPGAIEFPLTHFLFPGGGTIRTFTWDAPNDPNFVRINTPQQGLPLPPRNWTIRFRMAPIPESIPVTNRHEVETPDIVYYWLEDRSGEDLSEQRRAVLDEDFATDDREDSRETTALWGPPSNPDAVVGKITATDPNQQFGKGLARLSLVNVDADQRPEGFVFEAYLIDTDALRITYFQRTDNGTPGDATDDVLTPFSVDFLNPGQPKNEFHLASLFLGPDVQVLAVGINPLIIRLSGGATPSSNDIVFLCQAGSVLDLGGVDGEDNPRTPPGGNLDSPGRGGAGGPGGGAGGGGGSLSTAFAGVVAGPGPSGVLAGEDGGNNGGGGGETTCAFDPLAAAAGSKFLGGAGGGGGNRLSGGTGDTGTPIPTAFRPARGGRGGATHGDQKLLVLSPGSGGGGGGGTLGTDGPNGNFSVTGGAGGGGGGGAIQVVANGAIFIDPQAQILATGGKGGSSPALPRNPAPPPGSANGGAGGGGSGGCIVLQAIGSVGVACSSLKVEGGAHGTVQQLQNKIPGSGDGASGWIRIESASGGAPSCSPLIAETTLAAALDEKMVAVKVASIDGFPERGAIVVGDNTQGPIEEMTYVSITPGAPPTINVTRAPAPNAVQHASGAPVRLKGAVAPFTNPEVLATGGLTSSPDKVEPGKGRDGEIHIRFQSGIDPRTGLPFVDPVTGEEISVWLFDTDAGVIKNPRGDVVKTVAAADTNPGFLDASRLIVDQKTFLRGVGAHAMVISVSGQADIAGTLDASGAPGGLLRFSERDKENPLFGLGGRGGPGGADGGDGGTVEFIDGNLANKSPENTNPIHGKPGKLPPFTPPEWDRTPAPYGDGNPEGEVTPFPFVTRATPGASLRGQSCGLPPSAPCIQTAGGGAGGGNFQGGNVFDGTAKPQDNGLGGKGGSVFGIEALRFGGDYWRFGGTSGSGGGGNPQVSGPYSSKAIPGNYRFKGLAVFAPGTGGGGSGGALHLIAKNLNLQASGRILARGGNAFQSIDLGGNGGGGAGGNVLIQVLNSMTIEPGALIDVSGGTANRAVLAPPGSTIPDYEGNVRKVGTELRDDFGGQGGSGSPGRVRIEADNDSFARISGNNPSVSSGPFLLSTSSSIGVSKAVRLGVGPGFVAASHTLTLDAAFVRYFQFGQPNGTDSIVLWEGATESLDQHGGHASFLQQIRDPQALRFTEFIRFSIPFLSSIPTKETQSISEISLPYKLPSRSD